MLTYLALRAILNDIVYKPTWRFRMLETGGAHGWFVQVEFMAPDNDRMGSPPALVTGRKWYVSPHSTAGEVVQTAFLAIKTAEEHEMRELFTYRNARVFGPHHDIDALVTFALSTPEMVRATKPVLWPSHE